MTRRRPAMLLLVVLLLLVNAACDSGSAPAADAGPSEEVRFDETFAAACPALPSCRSGEVRTACTCVAVPSTDATFATNRVGCAELMVEGGNPRTAEDDFCDDAGPSGESDLACFMPGTYATAGTSMQVALYGVVDIFANGGDSEGITVAVYREGADGALGDLVGMSEPSSIDDAGCAETEDEIDGGEVTGTRTLGFYVVRAVPTETPLIIKTSGDPDKWKDLYTYNVRVSNDDVETASPEPEPDRCGSVPVVPRHHYKARTLARADYTTIPLTAGLVGGVAADHGAVAGEVHDCGDVRLEFAQVGVRPTPTVRVYFNDNADNPLPVVGRTEGTSLLGLYSGLDLPPGTVDVAALGRVGGDLVSLGWYRAQVFAGAVSVITLRGLRPEQVE